MKYLGGKSRISQRVVAIIDMVRMGRPFWDPFCGGLSTAVALSARGRGRISDANPALISLYQAVVAGWDPPKSLTEAEYKAAKLLPDTDPLKAFAGFGCSFGGKWFGGYARSGEVVVDPTKYASATRRGLLREVPLLARRGCFFEVANFLDVTPAPINQIIYLDPPYRGTTGYDATQPFDHDRFYGLVEEWGRHTDVFVSEYDLPIGRLVFETAPPTTCLTRQSGVVKRERLYHVGPSKIPTTR